MNDKLKLPKVSVIIVNYNGKKFLKDCFGSLYHSNYPQSKLEVIMVDNGSRDGSINFVRKNFPKVKILRSEVNNYCRANNLGIIKAKGEYVALLNNDTRVDKDWLLELVKAIIADRHIAAAGSKICFMDGRIESRGHVDLPNFYWKDRDKGLEDTAEGEKVEEVNSLSNCAILYRKEALEDVGYLDEDFNMYMEDIDVCIRLKKKRWKLVYVPKSVVYHFHHGSTNSKDRPFFYTEKNRLLLIAKHYPEKLSNALLGRGYFTLQKDLKSQGELYEILVDVILGVVKYHKVEVAKNVLSELFQELRKVVNFENSILMERLRHMQEIIGANQDHLKEKDKYIQSLNLEINKRDQILVKKDSYIEILEEKLKEKEIELKERHRDIGAMSETIRRKETELEERDKQIENLREMLNEKERYLNEKALHIRKLEEEFREKVLQFSQKDIWIENLKEKLKEKDLQLQGRDAQIKIMEEKLRENEMYLKRKDEQIDKLEQELKEREFQLYERDNKVNILEEKLREKGIHLNEKDEHIMAMWRELEGKEVQLEERDTRVKALEEELERKGLQIEEKVVRIEELLQGLRERDAVIEGKEKYIESLRLELNGIYNSTAFRLIVRPLWRFLWPIKKILNRLFTLLIPSRVLTFKGSHRFLEENRGESSEGLIGICTIISKNYLAYARVLAKSFLKHNEGRVFVLLTDSIEGYFSPQKESFTLLELKELKEKIPHFHRFCFQYNLTELNTAVKPYFLEFLFEKYKLKKLIYFDPDIFITHPLKELFELLDRYSILLIPHITRPFKDNSKPAEIEILKAGVYNLGFIGLSNTKTLRNLLSWWKERLSYYCKMDFQNGLFVDQKWIDLIPGFFEDVFILRDESYNVAYWNLHYRNVYLKGDRFLVNGKPLHFLHFSGFDPEDKNSISIHQNRFKLDELSSMKPIFELYRKLLFLNGYNSCKNWPSIFEHFDNGIKIPEIVRKIYWELDDSIKEKFGNPFNTQGESSYFNWLNEPIDSKNPPLTRLMLEIYKRRDDIKLLYRDILKLNRREFIKWFLLSGKEEYGLADEFLIGATLVESGNKRADSRRMKLGLKDRFKHKIKKELREKNPRFLDRLKILEMRFQEKGTSRLGLFWNKISSGIGVNLMGYLTAELGTGEGARANAKSLKAVGINVSLINIENHSVSRKCDFTFSEFSDHNPYPINLIHVNADMFPKLYFEKGHLLRNRYNIAFWNWELSDFPKEWLKSFKYCDEIWVPSSFAFSAIAKKSPLPVIKMPLAVEIDRIKDLNREDFGLKEEEFVFLFIFDFFSFFERKNPLGVIKAFQRAFSLSQNVKLVIKCINSSFDPQAMAKMREAAKGLNVLIMDKYLNRDETNSLLSLCDAYISLHRSEGFGLTLAEAMYLGKPVIATGYSGNMDFMNVNNSYLVRYNLVEIEKDVGPYKKGSLWAEPDVEHAAELMKKVHSDIALSKKVGEIASQDIRKNLNYKVIGQEIKERLEYIMGLKLTSDNS